MDRRKFLKTLSVAGGSGLAIRTARAEEDTGNNAPVAVLVDETRYTGCRMYERVCAEAHGLPALDFLDKMVFETQRTPTGKQLTLDSNHKIFTREVFFR